MSSKRILGLTLFGAAVIICVFTVMYVFSLLGRDPGEFRLPDTLPSETTEEPSGVSDGGLRRVDVTRDTVQEVVKSLSRPPQYTRDITFESFWDGGSAAYSITAALSGGVTSLRILSLGIEKRIIITGDTWYIWYQGDNAPFVRTPDSPDDVLRTSDEWQMMLTYEDILRLDKKNILDAGFTDYNGESCIYVDFNSPLLGYTTRCYISTELGLITGAEEYDGEKPVSRMTAGPCTIGEPDEIMFTLPDGSKAV